jgi:hypothetical protein
MLDSRRLALGLVALPTPVELEHPNCNLHLVRTEHHRSLVRTFKTCSLRSQGAISLDSRTDASSQSVPSACNLLEQHADAGPDDTASKPAGGLGLQET